MHGGWRMKSDHHAETGPKDAQSRSCPARDASITCASPPTSPPHSTRLHPQPAFTRNAYVMAIQSTLRPSKERIAQLAQSYGRHRPLIQRLLTVSFVVYVVGSTWKGFSARPSSTSSSSSKRKGKGKDGEESASKPRVAVSGSFALLFVHL